MTADFADRMPYPGLRAFGREDADLFFGREGAVNDMVDRLGRTRFLAALGTSGSGKSSLVRTGLLDGLEFGLLVAAGPHWRIVDFTPGDQPVLNLARTLLVSQFDSPGEPGATETMVLNSHLSRGPRSLIEWCRGELAPGENLLLLVDQFEELFRYRDYSKREEAEAFVALLLESRSSREAPIYVAITMRSEYLGPAALIDGLAEAINEGLYLTPRMTRDQVCTAIEGPAAVCDFKIEPALVNRLLNDLSSFAPWEENDTREQVDRLERRADQLPLLQHVLNWLWRRVINVRGRHDIVLKLLDYEALGGLVGALDQHAAEILGKLTDEQRQTTKLVFRALTRGTTAQNAVRNPLKLKDLTEIVDRPEKDVRAVVDAFGAAARNFLTLKPPPPAPLTEESYVDISHESLIRQWQSLRGWVDREADSAATWGRLVDAANAYRGGRGNLESGLTLANYLAWRKEQQPTAAWAQQYGGDFISTMAFLEESRNAQGKGRRQRYAAAATAAVLLLGVVVGGGYYELNRRASERQTAEAIASALEMGKVAAQAKASAQEAVEERQRAEEARREADNDRRLADNIINKSIALFGSSLADKVTEIHRNMWDTAEAGKLLVRAARLLLGTTAEDSASMSEQLRPAIATQLMLSGLTIPQASEWLTSMGASRLSALGSSRFALYQSSESSPSTRREVFVTDERIGAIRNRYSVPEGLSLDSDATHAVAGDGTVVVLDRNGWIWVASEPNTEFVRVEGLIAAAIDDIRFQREPNRLLLSYAARDTDLPHLAVLEPTHPGWRSTKDLALDKIYAGRSGRLPTSLAGAAANWVYLVAASQLYALDLNSGVSEAVSEATGISEAIVTADQSFVLAEIGGKSATLVGRDITATTLAFSPDSSRLVTASQAMAAHLWDAQNGVDLDVQLTHDGVLAVAFSPDGARIITGSNDWTARIFDSANGAQFLSLEGHTDYVRSVSFSPDGRFALTASDDGTARIWDAETGKEIRSLLGHSDYVRSAAFSPDGNRVATASDDKSVRVWDAQSGSQLNQLSGHTEWVTSVTFSPDGRHVLAAGGIARIWDAETGAELLVIGDGGITSAVFSSDGKEVATASSDGSVRRWSASDGSPVAVLNEQNGAYPSVAYSPDGRLLATSAWSGGVIWDISGKECPESSVVRGPPPRQGGPIRECLVAIDAKSRDIVWSGSVDGETLVETARGVEGPVRRLELLQSTGGEFQTLRISAPSVGGAPTLTTVPYDSADWGFRGFTDHEVARLLGDRRYSGDISRALRAGFADRTSYKLTNDGRPLALRLGPDAVQVAAERRMEAVGEDIQPADDLLPVRVGIYRHGSREVVRDDRFPAEVPCTPRPDAEQGCAVEYAAFSGDGNALLLASSGGDLVLLRPGGGPPWQRRLPSGPDDGKLAAGSPELERSAEQTSKVRLQLHPLDMEGEQFLVRSTPRTDTESGQGSAPRYFVVNTAEHRRAAEPDQDAFSRICVPAGWRDQSTRLVSDPGTGTVYFWGTRGIWVKSAKDALAKDGEGCPAETKKIDTAGLGEIRGVQPLSEGRVAVLSSTGKLAVLSPSGGRNLTSQSDLTVETGLRGGELMSTANGQIVVARGSGTGLGEGGASIEVSGIPDEGSGLETGDEGEPDRASLISVAYNLHDGRLTRAWTVPGERLLGQLASGEVVSSTFALEVQPAAPAPAPDDGTLRALILMRENDPAGNVERDIGFDFLAMMKARATRTAADKAMDPADCEQRLSVYVRSLEQGQGLSLPLHPDAMRLDETCGSSANQSLVKTLMQADAAGDQGDFMRRFREAALALSRRAAHGDHLALGALHSIALGWGSSEATGMLVDAEPSLATRPFMSQLVDYFTGGKIELRLAAAAQQRAGGADPFDHWLLAILAEREGREPERLARALYHYKLTERILESLDLIPNPRIVERRVALARILSDELVVQVFQDSQAFPIHPGPGEPGSADAAPADAQGAALEEAVAWLEKAHSASPGDAAAAIFLAVALEGLGDEMAEANPPEASRLFARALSLIAHSASQITSYPVRDEVERLREKFLSTSDISDPTLDRAVLHVLDATLPAPDSDPANRSEIKKLFQSLLNVDPNVLTRGEFPLEELRFGFLDFDYQTRARFIDASSSTAFADELRVAAELFGKLAESATGGTPKWRALQGRMLYWLSALKNEEIEGFTEDQFSAWLDESIAQLKTAAGHPDGIELWDRFIRAEALEAKAEDLYSKGLGWEEMAEQAGAEYRRTLTEISVTPPDLYRQRLIYNSAALNIDNTQTNISDEMSEIANKILDGPISSTGMTDLAFRSLLLAREFETIRAEASARQLLADLNSTWMIYDPSDRIWGRAVAILGATVRANRGLNGAPTPCDKAAAHPYDVDRPSPGLDYKQLDADVALTVCPVEDLSPRIRYLRGRALSKHTEKREQAVRLLLSAARDGVPIAYNNLAAQMDDVGQSPEVASLKELMYTAFSVLSLDKVYADITPLLTEAADTDDRRRSLEWLTRKAADFGIPEAQRDLASMVADTSKKGFHLSVTAKLFQEAGQPAQAEAMQSAYRALSLAREVEAQIAQRVTNWRVERPRLLDDQLEAELLAVLLPGT